MCLRYARADDEIAGAALFLRRGLGDGDKVVCIADERERSALLKSLWDAQVDVSPALACGQLEVVSPDATYRARGSFDIDSMLELVNTFSERTVADGFRRLRITGEPARAVRPGDLERVLEYERRVADLLERVDAAALCRYRDDLLDERSARDLAAAHALSLSTVAGRLRLDAPLLEVAQTVDGVLRVAGELDAFNANPFLDVLERAAAASVDVRLDVRDLRFVDVAGMRALYVTAGLLGARGGRLSLAGADGAVRRGFELAGWDPLDCLVLL